MADESEKIIDAFLAPANEVNQELAPSQKQEPEQPKSDEQTVASAARKAGDTTETAIQKAARKGNKSARKVADRNETEEEKAAREAQEQAEAAREQAEANKSALQQSLDAPGGLARRTSNWLASAPTPGGIGALVLALLFFLWAIVPVNAAGDTRLKLLWYTLIGRTQFTESTQVAGGSADFGDNTATTGSGNGTGPVDNGNVAASGPDIIILSPFEV